MACVQLSFPLQYLASIVREHYIPRMEWHAEYTDEFGAWWDGLTADEQEDINAMVILLQRFGPALRFPYTSSVVSSRHAHMRELRVQHAGRPYRVLYAFDPLRRAIFLIGGDKTGNDRWYDTHVPLADRLYDDRLAQLRREGKLPDG
jgi:hypothetical protein